MDKYRDSSDFKIRHFKAYSKAIRSSYGKIRYDQIIGLIPQHFDVILLAIVVDIQTVGIYQFAKRLVEPINYLVVTFNPWLQNKLKSEDKDFNITSFFRRILLPISILLFGSYFSSSLLITVNSSAAQACAKNRLQIHKFFAKNLFLN